MGSTKAKGRSAEPPNRKRRWSLLVLFFLGAALGVVGDRLLRGDDAAQDASPLESRKGVHDFVNPLLECNDFKPLGLVRTGLRHTLQNLIDDKRKEGLLSVASVYFRDLNNGPWFGIGEKEVFSPASLMKVPLLIGYMKHAEKEPGLLQKKMAFKSSERIVDQNIPPAESLTPGASYSVKDLLYRMIVHSDNEAAAVLFKNDGNHYFERMFSDLGLLSPEGKSSWRDYGLRVKDYASFFRILYNASYLGEEESNKALALLTLTKFNKGLPAGVPQGIPIAHKFGERGDGTDRQLHDCGIIYHPRTPYLLCVMTRGSDLSVLSSIIADISRTVYNGVDSLSAQ